MKRAARSSIGAVFALVMMSASVPARADSLATLKDFVRDVKTGRADFVQTVTSPDGAKKKTSSGNFEFSRPNHFRFAYTKPYEQLIVGDGQNVWLYDAELNQVTQRPFSQAMGATPAALLAGGSLDQDFDFKPLPDEAGLQWLEALPRVKDGPFQSLKLSFKGNLLNTVEIVDSFGQRSLLQFNGLQANVPLAADRFTFTPPAGADLIKP